MGDNKIRETIVENLERNKIIIPEAVIDFFYRIISNYCIEKIIIFGSRAYHDEEPTSDIDIAIVSSILTRIELLQIKFIVDEVRTLLKLGIVHFNSNPKELQCRINKTGVIIYEQKKGIR